MSREISTRIFLVGCGRSGTTLLQSLLAANSHMTSFPETHFYERLVRGRLLTALGVPSHRARSHWGELLGEIGHPEMEPILPENAIFIRQFSKAFVRVLDTIALDQEKFVWLEKTPGHLRHIKTIEKLVDRTRFVHIVRNGEDTIASINELRDKHPRTWGRWFASLDHCIQRWVTDVRISKEYASKENHRLVRYEQLVKNPKIVLEDICNFVDVPFEENMLANHIKSADRLILEAEPWKNSVNEPIWTTGKRRFYEFLNEEERQYIRSRIPEDLLDDFTP